MNNELLKNLFKLIGSNNMMLQTLMMKLLTKEEYNTIMGEIDKKIEELFEKENQNETI